MLMVPGDALALSALTGLTRLAVLDTERGLDTAAASAIAGSLKQLRHLELHCPEVDLSSSELLAALGQLTQLTALHLKHNVRMKSQELMQLTGLRRLKKLQVDKTEGFTFKVGLAFWTAVRQLQQQDFRQ
jgi:hypothetical protein